MDRLHMNDGGTPRALVFRGTGANWLQRVLLTVVGAGLLVVAFFFVTLALIAGALLALIIGVRWWWLMRRLRAEREASAPLEGQYTVLEDTAEPGRRLEH
jgi:predicted lipid-binding transport protein (Tim44 family)